SIWRSTVDFFAIFDCLSGADRAEVRQQAFALAEQRHVKSAVFRGEIRMEFGGDFSLLVWTGADRSGGHADHDEHMKSFFKRRNNE
ncbi:hypothetical protein GOODEAATRI_016455, partial [Goodea atripinnis]